ncbi:MAG: DUF2313 domain-containing protein [Clostridiales bacterium]|nr:DUF2313 domain-containing protein [Clostridiales bacterium]
MTREVDLVSYLPPFMAEFKEVTAALEAENPEFALVREAAERVLQNEFVETADEYGIARFEKILHITPDKDDTLDGRRFRILTRLNEELPYTLSQLHNILRTLCGEGNYSVDLTEDAYQLTVKVGLTVKNNFQDVLALLERVVPSNILVSVLQLYNTWEDVKRYTWEDAAKYTWKEFKEEVLT